MGDEADADWDAGLIEWGREDTEVVPRVRRRAKKIKKVKRGHPLTDKQTSLACATDAGARSSLTVAMLVAETLAEKNRRLRQEKCKHQEIFSSTCAGPAGTFTTAVCTDCGKTWRGEAA